MARSRQQSRELLTQMQLDAAQAVRAAAEGTERQLHDVRRLAAHQVSQASSAVPAARAEARRSLQTARASIQAEKAFVLDRAAADVHYMADATGNTFEGIADLSRQAVTTARMNTQVLMRVVAGQGPAKTLSRGFALVRDASGNAITSATCTQVQVTIQFRDGSRAARLQEDKEP